jgi:hypothetical protein
MVAGANPQANVILEQASIHSMHWKVRMSLVLRTDPSIPHKVLRIANKDADLLAFADKWPAKQNLVNPLKATTVPRHRDVETDFASVPGGPSFQIVDGVVRLFAQICNGTMVCQTCLRIARRRRRRVSATG